MGSTPLFFCVARFYGAYQHEKGICAVMADTFFCFCTNDSPVGRDAVSTLSVPGKRNHLKAPERIACQCQ